MAERKGTIVYIGGFEMPDKNAAANRVLNNAKAFAELGYKVVFCGVDHEIEENANALIKFEGFESWPSKYPSSTKEWIREQVSFKYIKGVLEKYDDVRFVIGYNMHALPLRNLENWSKKKNVKVLIDATEWYPNRFSLKLGKLIRWVDTNLAMRWYQKKVDGVIAISSVLAKYYQKYVKNVIIVPPLVDINDDLWQQIASNCDNKIRFTYTGRAGNGKDIIKDKIDIIIDAFCSIPSSYDFFFSVVGMTERECEEMFPGIKDKIKCLGGKIEFCGKVSHGDSIKALIESDYCIFLRERNRQTMAGFPTKFSECITTGVGIIVNDVSDIKQYFPIKNGTIIDTIELSDVTKAILEAIENGKTHHSNNDLFNYRNYEHKLDSFLQEVRGV